METDGCDERRTGKAEGLDRARERVDQAQEKKQNRGLKRIVPKRTVKLSKRGEKIKAQNWPRRGGVLVTVFYPPSRRTSIWNALRLPFR